MQSARIDDHAIMRMGLASLLGSEPGMEIAGDAEDGRGGENIVDI